MKTKIICTIGPSSNTPERLKELIEAGMGVARINCSHGTLEQNEANIHLVQQVRAEMGVEVLIMLDTKGPDVRIGYFEGDSAMVTEGQIFKLFTTDALGNYEGVYVNYDKLPQVVKPGQELRLNDGMVIMEVESVTDTEVICRVKTSGKLSNRKSLAVPGCDLQLPFISKADEEDLVMGCRNNVDLIAASFVGSAKDVTDMKEILKANGKDIPIISKIESKFGIQNIDEILKVTEGVMVARGDLGVEYPVEQIPALQKLLILKTRAAGKLIATATEMLESMIEKPRPTRAETTDIANAVWDGTNFVMLSGETAMGKFPVQCVQYMARIAEEAEKMIDTYGRKL